MTVQLKEVSKTYSGQFAVDNVSLSLEKGKIYGLLGSNGSGKSTTLKMIAGLVKPDAGQILVEGTPVNRRIAEKVAYLTELDFYYHPFSVQQTIDFNASQFPDFDRQKADKMLQFMGINPKSLIGSLSKGNRGRVKLVLALSRRAPVILLDEPFSGLDQMVRESIVRGLLSFIDFETQTVLITTHEIDEIETLLDEVIVIKNGKFIAHEKVEQVREEQGKSVVSWMKDFFNEEKESV
ncbi:ABC transporter ATP-binding protein [Bacillus sp. CECT 9360]|uniref:ABC transporter ATP-binding protein n=1 Tax=Bacillus sp. CECT 9360 TaxID=2845821 RepID=UPI001E35AE12|nr:ABC transporter ATP-binding protein [Bacillus sp. CECT 9360]CAH0346547.1 ABC transporter ATP-binding protein YtrB [Bacillus sp. CECT 9360]